MEIDCTIEVWSHWQTANGGIKASYEPELQGQECLLP